MSEHDIEEKKDLVRLREILTERFSKDDLRILCFDLNVPYDNIEGDSHGVKVVGLIEYMKRHNRIPKLEERVRTERPDAQF
ncbi:MAG: hypothetical protein R6X32_10100 [Chloroflexota bacterium]